MAGERTPLFSANGTPRRQDKRKKYAKIALGVVLATALAAIITHYATRSTSATSAEAGASITEANWFCGETDFEADYIKLSNKQHDDEYFYWLVRSRSASPSTDPLVLWLTGGPGASSIMAMLTENGPCMVKPDLTTHFNKYSWSNNANMIWLDQPSGVGFSSFDTNSSAEEQDSTEQDVGANIFAFLNGFLDKHPEFQGREFYITGESYGGHYIPGAAHFIWQQNKLLPKKRINLQGIAIGNGLTNPNIQYKYNQDMAYNQYKIPLLSDPQISQMKQDAEGCIALTELCQQVPSNGTICADAMGCWGEKLIGPFTEAHVNPYDIRIPCKPDQPPAECGLDYSFLSQYFDLDIVKKHLEVVKHPWIDTNIEVNQHFVASGDWSFAYHTYVADLLNDGLRVLIYAGDADLMCNWIGNKAWTLALDWQGKNGFNAAPEQVFETKDPFVKAPEMVDAGVVRQFENFAFVRLYNAGHMVPMDQPAVSYVMLDKFLTNKKY